MTQYYVSTGSAPSGTWFHGVFVLDGPTPGISMYIDGALISTADSGWDRGGFADNEGDVVLGREYTSGDHNYADATVDELYFWEEALSDVQTAALYNLYNP